MATVLVVVLAVFAYGAHTWAPVWFHFPVAVQVNDQLYEVKSGTDVMTFLTNDIDLKSYQGALKTDTGVLLDAHGGGPAAIFVDGRPLQPDQQVERGAKIRVTQGGTVIHPTVQKAAILSPHAKLQGKGSLIALLQQGQSGKARQTADRVTGKILETTTVEVPQDTVLQAYATTGVSQKVVALTFDDGPNDGETQAIVAILQEQQVKATFFELGTNIQRYPALSAACVNAGNLVGLHSWDHKNFTKLSADQIDAQLNENQAALKAATGQTTAWVRAPYGATNTEVDVAVTARGFHMAGWTVDPKDWARPGVDKIVERVVAGARPGAIILMHDGGGNRDQTVAALPQIIAALKDQGYGFVTVSEMYALAGGK